jgi:hypothetical protein
MVRGLRVEIGLHLLLAYDCVFRASAPASNLHFNVLFTAFHVSYLTSHFIIPHSLSSESSIACHSYRLTDDHATIPLPRIYHK